MTYGRAIILLMLAFILPNHSEGQESAPHQPRVVQSVSPRPIAPPAVQRVPPGSASTSPSQRRPMEAVRMADTDRSRLDGRLDEDVWMAAVTGTNFSQVA